MTVRHHPDETLLLDYASGAADQGTALIVAVHLCYCADCRQSVALAEAAGGALLETQTVPMAADALESVLSKLDEAVPSATSRPTNGTPSPLWGLLPGGIKGAPWHKMGPRLAFANLRQQGAMRVRLLRAKPGADTGPHSHHGLEYSLVLAGGYTDETGNYGSGDVQVADAATLHNPLADPGEDCIILAVTTAPLRFRSRLQGLAARLFGF